VLRQPLSTFGQLLHADQAHLLPPTADRLGMPAAGPAGMQLVWTTASEVQNSLEGWAAGASIPGPERNVTQPWLQPFYHR
jgi:hypothetical protein